MAEKVNKSYTSFHYHSLIQTVNFLHFQKYLTYLMLLSLLCKIVLINWSYIMKCAATFFIGNYMIQGFFSIQNWVGFPVPKFFSIG